MAHQEKEKLNIKPLSFNKVSKPTSETIALREAALVEKETPSVHSGKTSTLAETLIS